MRYARILLILFTALVSIAAQNNPITTQVTVKEQVLHWRNDNDFSTVHSKAIRSVLTLAAVNANDQNLPDDENVEGTDQDNGKNGEKKEDEGGGWDRLWDAPKLG